MFDFDSDVTRIIEAHTKSQRDEGETIRNLELALSRLQTSEARDRFFKTLFHLFHYEFKRERVRNRSGRALETNTISIIFTVIARHGSIDHVTKGVFSNIDFSSEIALERW